MGWIHLLRVSVAAVIGQQAVVVGLDNGAARRPPMGWLAWQRFRCYDECATDPENCLSERLIKMVADHLVSDGYRDAGYTTVNLDACWWDAAKPRDAAGRLVADPKRFPSGISGLVSYMEARGLQLGTYALMDGPPGGNGPQFLDGKTATSRSAHWQTDVEDLAKSGVHSIKVDSGAVTPTNMQWPAFNLTYPALGAALGKAGYNGVYTCSWPACKCSRSLCVFFRRSSKKAAAQMRCTTAGRYSTSCWHSPATAGATTTTSSATQTSRSPAGTPSPRLSATGAVPATHTTTTKPSSTLPPREVGTTQMCAASKLDLFLKLFWG